MSKEVLAPHNILKMKKKTFIFNTFAINRKTSRYHVDFDPTMSLTPPPPYFQSIKIPRVKDEIFFLGKGFES